MRVVVIPSRPDYLIIAVQSVKLLFPEILLLIDTRLVQIEFDLQDAAYSHQGIWEMDYGTHIMRVN